MTYKRFKTSCLDCKQEISSFNFSKHINSNRCKNPYIKSKEYDDRKTRSNCIKCGKFCKSFTSLTQHEIRCKGIFLIEKRCELCQKLFSTTNKRKKYCSNECSRSKQISQEHRNKISEGMKRAVKKYPQSFAGGYNRGRVKSLVCSNGFVVLGEWERSFVEFCLENNIKIEQPNTGFSYHWNGDRTYFPDFYLPDTDLWVEIKGLQTERDLAKWESLRNTHKKELLVLNGPPSWILTNDQQLMRMLLLDAKLSAESNL